jgi:hypothetical protein
MPSVCFVAPAIYPFQSFSEEALEVWVRGCKAVADGLAVTVLLVTAQKADWAAARVFYRAHGMELVVSSELEESRHPDEIFGRDLALAVFPALRWLHGERSFDRVDLPVAGGFALRVAQAAVAGPLFDDTRLVLRLGCPGEWKRHRHRCLPLTREEVKADFAERETVEISRDVRMASAAVREFVESLGWRLDHGRLDDLPPWPDRVEAGDVAPAVPCFLSDGDDEWGFFLRTLRGRGVGPICLAVPAGRLTDSQRDRVRTLVRQTGGSLELLAPRRWDLLPAVLREKGAIVVHAPGVVDFRLRWLAASGVGFVWERATERDCPALADFRELAYADGQPESLASALAAAARFGAWPDVFAAVGGAAGRDVECVEDRKNPPRSVPPARVVLAVSHYNLGPLMGETLEALAAQDYPACEVMVVDDGSTDPAALAAFRRFAVEFPGFEFVELPHVGYWSPRNHAIRTGSAPYLIIVDGDNLPVPQMASRFVEALERNPDVAAFSSYVAAFRETREAARSGRFEGTHTPLGGDIVSGHFENIYGDTNSIFRREAIQDIGGFREDFPCSFGDWEIFHRLVGAGHRLGVVPEVLLHYRRRAGGMIRQSPLYPNFFELLRVLTPGRAVRPADQRRLNHALHGLGLPR